MFDVYFQDRLLGRVSLSPNDKLEIVSAGDFDLESFVGVIRESHKLNEVSDSEFLKRFPTAITGYYFAVPVESEPVAE